MPVQSTIAPETTDRVRRLQAAEATAGPSAGPGGGVRSGEDRLVARVAGRQRGAPGGGGAPVS